MPLNATTFSWRLRPRRCASALSFSFVSSSSSSPVLATCKNFVATLRPWSSAMCTQPYAPWPIFSPRIMASRGIEYFNNCGTADVDDESKLCRRGLHMQTEMNCHDPLAQLPTATRFPPRVSRSKRRGSFDWSEKAEAAAGPADSGVNGASFE